MKEFQIIGYKSFLIKKPLPGKANGFCECDAVIFLQFKAGAYIEQHQIFAGIIKFLFGFLMVDFDKSERVIVNTKDFVTFQKIARDNGIVNSHCKIISYGKNGEIEPGLHRD